MMRCRLAAAMAARQTLIAMWKTKRSFATNGQASSAAASRTATMVARLGFGDAPEMVTPVESSVLTVIASYRSVSRLSLFACPEQTPGPEDQQNDDDAERRVRSDRSPVKGSEQALGEPEDDPAQRRARNAAHAAQN